MDETTGDADGWVVARVAALERANRRLWIAFAALGMTLVSVCLVALFVGANLALPSGGDRRAGNASWGNLVADDVTVRGALRVVDASGQSLVWIGRERPAAAATAGKEQAVIGLFAGAGAEAPQQTIRLATSPLGSALSLSTPDGSSSVSVFAGESAVSLELQRDKTARVISERADGASSAPSRASEGPRVEAPAVARAAAGEAGRGEMIDLTDAAIQPIGDGFYVGRLALNDQSGVLRLSGRLINSTSIDQLRAEFRLSVAGRDLPFSVGGIPAGSSTAFTVELPAANSTALRAARLRWVRSTLRYQSE